MMIHLAILLHSRGKAAYQTLRKSRASKLPGSSTLHEYTNNMHPREGFEHPVQEELQSAADKLEPHWHFVTLLHDEMSIKPDLVFDKRSGAIAGFVNRDTWSFEGGGETLATQALTFFIVGIKCNIKMSLGFFGTRSANADELGPLFWQAVAVVEETGLKAIISTSNKAPANQRLYQMHGHDGEICHKTLRNVFSPDRNIYFISGPPQLVKTARNTLSSSARNTLSSSARNTLSSSARNTLSGSARKNLSGSARKNLSGSARKNLSGSARKNLSGSARKNLSGSARKNLSGSARKNLSSSARKNLSSSARNTLSSSARNTLSSSARNTLSSSARNTLSSSARNTLSGSARNTLSGSGSGENTRLLWKDGQCIRRQWHGWLAGCQIRNVNSAARVQRLIVAGWDRLSVHLRQRWHTHLWLHGLLTCVCSNTPKSLHCHQRGKKRKKRRVGEWGLFLLRRNHDGGRVRQN